MNVWFMGLGRALKFKQDEIACVTFYFWLFPSNFPNFLAAIAPGLICTQEKFCGLSNNILCQTWVAASMLENKVITMSPNLPNSEKKKNIPRRASRTMLLNTFAICSKPIP